MKPIIKLENVDLTYPILSVKAKSIRNAIFNFSVGGKLLRDGTDRVYVKALAGINFELFEGDSLGIIGHNGSGKTTLLKVLAGIYEPTRGRISVDGRISSMIDINLGLDANLTGRENIITLGRMKGLTTKEILSKMDEIIEFSGISSYIDLPIKTFSSGMASRLVFSVATTLDPDVLLFDEWIGTGDSEFIVKATDRLHSLVNQSRVMVLATHALFLIATMCNKVLVLDGGKQIYFGPVGGWDFEKAAPKAMENIGANTDDLTLA